MCEEEKYLHSEGVYVRGIEEESNQRVGEALGALVDVRQKLIVSPDFNKGLRGRLFGEF